MISDIRRVLLLNGIVRSADAISRSLLLKLETLEQAFEGSVRVDVAAYAIDDGVPNAHPVKGLADLLYLEAFRRADLIIYEFGIFYDLFGSVRFAPPQAHTVVVWHNVTPPELAPSSTGRALMMRSLDQVSNMLCCDHVLCDSSFNASELDGLGFDPDRVSVLNLPVSASLMKLGAKPWRHPSEKLRFLFVGRFVPSKGVVDLVQALGDAVRQVPCNVELSLVGNVSFSEPKYINKLNDAIAASDVDIRFCGTLSDGELAMEFRAADIFVMPSYHEGYCLPALEAFAAGCHVIAYDAGNLPSIVAPYGDVVKTGDVAGLRDALAQCLSEHRQAQTESRERAFKTGKGRLPEPQRRLQVRRYAAGFSETVYAEGLLSELAKVCARERLSCGNAE